MTTIMRNGINFKSEDHADMQTLMVEYMLNHRGIEDADWNRLFEPVLDAIGSGRCMDYDVRTEKFSSRFGKERVKAMALFIVTKNDEHEIYVFTNKKYKAAMKKAVDEMCEKDRAFQYAREHEITFE